MDPRSHSDLSGRRLPGFLHPDDILLAKIRETARRAVDKASGILLDGMSREIAVSFKGRINLVTEVDLASERSIIETISSEFPDHGFLGEEGGDTLPDNPAGDRWIIDPLDGTTNYAHRYPFFSISVAFESQGIIRYGIVFDPLRNIAFEGMKGKGATINRKPMGVSKVSDPERCLLATGFSYTHAESFELKNMRTFEGFSRKCQGIRRSGSAALDLCHVAMGALDGFWEMNLAPWDTAAGTLIVEESGGKVSDGTGDLFYLDSPIVVASNGLIQRWMLETIKGTSEEPEQK